MHQTGLIRFFLKGNTLERDEGDGGSAEKAVRSGELLAITALEDQSRAKSLK